MKGVARRQWETLLRRAADARAKGDDSAALSLLDQANKIAPKAGRPRHSVLAEAQWIFDNTRNDTNPWTAKRCAQEAILLNAVYDLDGNRRPPTLRRFKDADFERLARRIRKRAK